MKLLKEYFVFSSTERRGIFLFSALLLLMLLGYVLIPIFISNPVGVNKEYREEIKQLLAQTDKPSVASLEKHNITLFKFNPNLLSKEGFLNLGLSEKQTKTILNYRNKGGRFYKKEDFKKIYSITDNDYKRLSPYLIFKAKESYKSKYYKEKEFKRENETVSILFKFDPNTVSKGDLMLLGFSEKQSSVFLNYRTKGGKFYKTEDVKKIYSITEKLFNKIEPYIEFSSLKAEVKEEKIVSIEINTATAEEFAQIRGIGEKISARIIKYRERLGGFYSINHLAEVYGVEQELVDNNKSFFTINKSKIKTININTVTIKELYKHPYISFNDARKIVNFKEQHGLYTTVDEIRTNDLVKEEVYSKIVNYLSIL